MAKQKPKVSTFRLLTPPFTMLHHLCYAGLKRIVRMLHFHVFRNTCSFAMAILCRYALPAETKNALLAFYVFSRHSHVFGCLPISANSLLIFLSMHVMRAIIQYVVCSYCIINIRARNFEVWNRRFALRSWKVPPHPNSREGALVI